MGWQGKVYGHNQVEIEGVPFISDEARIPTSCAPKVTIADNKLTMAVGIFDEYTMLNYLTIEAIAPAPRGPGCGNGFTDYYCDDKYGDHHHDPTMDTTGRCDDNDAAL
ncbi:MAG: hypothetical protein R2932_07205 [Caldilineaceae bacterium]